MRILVLAAVAVCLIAAFLLFLRARRSGAPQAKTAGSVMSATAETTKPHSSRTERAGSSRADIGARTKETAQEIVARKLVQFTQNRHDLVYRLAARGQHENRSN